MGMRRRSSQLFATCAAVAVVLGLAACAPHVDARGNLPDPEQLAEIKPGSHTRQEVGEILGSPSSKAILDEETWYYISKRTETLAFFEPEIRERQIVIVRFDAEGVVAEVQTLNLEQGRDIRPVDRVTPTAGNELTIMEQLFGNFGRFNKGQ
jgi:outer membrane protein assembly factor BamE (lipoprotein component of BamABCDE complex)